MKHLIKYSWAVLLLMTLTLVYSCKKDKQADVIAGFTYAQDASNFLKITFTNNSENADTYSWNFGDNATSTEKDPVHTYTAAGTYTVILTATSGGSTDSYQQSVVVEDPNAMLTALAGDGSKTWKLIRDVSTNRFPLEVGPADKSTIWWAFGKNENLSKRPCMLNDEWTFTRDGLKMDYDAKGDYWAEGGLFTPDNTCASTSTMVSPTGDDLSAWGSGSHTFVLTSGANPTLKVDGLGAFIGLCKVATSSEVKVPQSSVTYSIIKLTDGAVDTLIIQTSYNTGDTPPIPAYWRFVLVHYDDPSQEPAIPGDPPIVNFTYTFNGLTFNGTNTSTDGTTYAWDFGDGGTATTANATHTYASAGIYTVSFSATNSNGTSTTSAVVFASTEVLTDALLQGAAWKVKVDNMTVFVGDGMGRGNWWSVPVGFLNGGSVGTGDDWSCVPDDEFTFSAGGVFTYDTKGSARNDGYFGSPNGCIDDAGIAASGNGAAFGSATHSYTFTPATASSRGLITLTNGAGKAAFLGFYKGFNGIASSMPGGENSNKDNPPNGGSPTNTYEVMGYGHIGGKEVLFVSVDFTADHSGHGWSAILER
jgi:PKD repeat protein